MRVPRDSITIAQATTTGEIAAARELIREYGESLGIDLSYQNFEAELESLPGDYAPPRGALLLARSADEFIGCIAMRPLAPEICEMKRLYVRPAWRAHGIGAQLVDTLIANSRAASYHSLRLDTLPAMKEARGLYESLGFREIPAYYESPIAGTTFLELDLTASRKS